MRGCEPCVSCTVALSVPPDPDGQGDLDRGPPQGRVKVVVTAQLQPERGLQRARPQEVRLQREQQAGRQGAGQARQE